MRMSQRVNGADRPSQGFYGPETTCSKVVERYWINYEAEVDLISFGLDRYLIDEFRKTARLRDQQ